MAQEVMFEADERDISGFLRRKQTDTGYLGRSILRNPHMGLHFYEIRHLGSLLRWLRVKHHVALLAGAIGRE